MFKGLSYTSRTLDLVRFVDDPTDDAVLAVLRDVARSDETQRRALRGTLSDDDAYTLLGFARRRSVFALRERSLPAGLEAIDALTLVPAARVGRDFSADFPLLAVRTLGGHLESVVATAIARSDDRAARVFQARSLAVRTTPLRDCMLVEVRSSYGLGFLEDRSLEYQAHPALAAAVVDFADELDAEGSYIVEGLHGSDLPGIWFGAEPRLEPMASIGCVSLTARHHRVANRWGEGLLVFVAEVNNAQDATDLAAPANSASTPQRPRHAVATGNYLAVVIGGSSSAGDHSTHETPTSLETYCQMAARCLGA